MKSEAARRTISAHEFRPLHSFSSFGSGRPQDAFPFGATLRGRVASSAFRLSPATHRHGFCATDLARGTARHCHLFECKTGGALSLGLLRTGGQIDLGRRPRATGLAVWGIWPRASCAKPGISMREKNSVWSWQTRSMRWTPRRSIFRSRSFPGPTSAKPKPASSCTPKSICGARFPPAFTSPVPANTMFAGSTNSFSSLALAVAADVSRLKLLPRWNNERTDVRCYD